MKIKYCTFLILLLSNLIYSQTQDSSSYFPLAIGNKWVYQNVFQTVDSTYIDSVTVTVKDTQRVKVKLYYGVDEFSHNWYREDSNKVYIVDTSAMILDTSNIREYLLYDFTADTSESWDVSLSDMITNCFWGGTLKLKSKNESITTPSGIFSKCCLIYHTISPCRDGGMVNEWFAPGVGKVAYDEESISGIRKYNLMYSNVITDVSDYNHNDGINKFELFQNYPNPFNPFTTIKYSIPHRSSVKITIFDLLGRKTATIVNDEQEAGTHQIKFDGSSLPSGVYFYQLRAGTFIETKKMIIMK